MKKIFTLAAAGALAATALNAQAQITLDGVMNTAEIGAANSGRYVSLGAFTTPHPAGFGDWGLLRMYGANTASKLYVALAGTPEANGNGLQIYMDFPNKTGVTSGTALPAVTGPVAGTATTMFEGAGITGTKMDMEVDAALALKGESLTSFIPQAAVYTSNTAGTAAVLATTMTATGAPITIAGATGNFAMFNGSRMAYRGTSDGKITTNPGNANGGGAGSYGWEIELDRTALGLPSGASIVRLFAGYVSNTGYWSSDVIPEIAGNAAANLENSPDFTQETGTQAATLNVVVLSNRNAAEAAVAMSVFPNPSSSKATVTYQVLNRAQNVNVTLTDLTGRTVRVLKSGVQAAGFQSISLSTQDVAAGTYMVNVKVGDLTATRKVVLL
ncbi:T9SS type A sorting domain-containing protein [Hymenobacter yonginensis]|uniref:T9SS type A sorting domain-containing protein n=1 Tax=Hymenobacter yonginensis TaxID=748197 RepID=A0ABY7PRR8_9BACT|nr:T9SS type A sorting domain-containing protein [Hymenobacter yonginensis]WBO85575.1 T9SS type A sorting domain-containing protein [Hymenobacter yonginensis]